MFLHKAINQYSNTTCILTTATCLGFYKQAIIKLYTNIKVQYSTRTTPNSSVISIRHRSMFTIQYVTKAALHCSIYKTHDVVKMLKENSYNIRQWYKYFQTPIVNLKVMYAGNRFSRCGILPCDIGHVLFCLGVRPRNE